MRVSSRAIIIKDNKVLTMFRRRIKDGVTTEYYVIPGGGQDDGESLEETVKRELKEEMNVNIKILGYLGNTIWQDTNSNFFHCEIIDGVPHLGGEELERMKEDNFYDPRFIDLSLIDSLDIKGKEFIKKALNNDYIIINDSKKF